MVDQEIISLIYLGKELRNLEFKQSMNWNDTNTKSKVIKSLLSLSNLKDGGYLIFGVKQENSTFYPEGMSKEDYDSFIYDDVKSLSSKCSDPYVEFDMEKIEHDGKLFVVFIIQPFDQIPVICKSSGPNNDLKVGFLYTRTLRTIESAPVSQQNDMREIIEIAIEKGLTKFVERAAKVGLIHSPSSFNTDNQKFNEQISDLL